MSYFAKMSWSHDLSALSCTETMNRYKLGRPLKVVHINTLLALLHIFVVIDYLIAIHFKKNSFTEMLFFKKLEILNIKCTRGNRQFIT